MSASPARRRARRPVRRDPNPATERIAEPFPAQLTIGVVADTHVVEHGSRVLPPEVPALFRRFGVGLVLHAGDICIPSVVAELAVVAPVLAVHGNGDYGFLTEDLPARVDFLVGQRPFVLVHGHQKATADATARSLAGTADCVVYGHSHRPVALLDRGTVLFNPGSATDRRGQPHFGVGILRVGPAAIEPELILFDRPRDLDGVEAGPPAR